jgi:D-alanyl-D-alanine carboxypeptidase
MNSPTHTANMLRLTVLALVFAGSGLLLTASQSAGFSVCSRSAVLLDASNGGVLFEQDADALIAPASVTKIMTLYLVFDAIKEGKIHPWDRVTVSKRAAQTGGSRMGLRAREVVPVEELVNGIAIVSGNDAAVAVAEHLSGSVEGFVKQMNDKARVLGMHNTLFLTPNGLPAKGQVTTARDLARLSISYLRHYPDSLNIHSMTSYTYNQTTHHNANRLLGTCPGVDGIKTGFVCASGFNLSATAKRGDVRLIAVVMGARSACVRAQEAERLLEAGFYRVQTGNPMDDYPGASQLARGGAKGTASEQKASCSIPTPSLDKRSAKMLASKTKATTAPATSRKASTLPSFTEIKPSGGAKEPSSQLSAGSNAKISPVAVSQPPPSAPPPGSLSKTQTARKKTKLLEGSEPSTASRTIKNATGGKSKASGATAASANKNTKPETSCQSVLPKQPEQAKKSKSSVAPAKKEAGKS